MMALSALSIIRLMPWERCQDIAMLAVKNRNETGVPNDGFEENPLYSVFNITRVSLRQSCLIFNFPGKKIPALHRQQAGF